MSATNVDSIAAAAVWIVLKASIVVGIAALVQLVVRSRASAATRHFLWALAILGVLVLPAASFVLPEWTVPVRMQSADAPSLRVASGPVPAQSPEVSNPVAGGSDPAPALRIDAPLDWRSMILAIYIIGTIASLLVLVLQHVNVRRFARRADEVRDLEWMRLLRASCEHIGVRRPVRLLMSREHTVPFTFGLRAASIVIPSIAGGWAEDRRRAVLRHELAHVARYDCLTQTLARAACAMYWFHPAVWWVAGRLRLERELACDDRVIETGTAAREYAGHLLEIAYSVGRHRAPALAVSMARRRQLEGRMLAALDAAQNRSVPTARYRLASGAIALAVLYPVTGLVPVAVPADRRGDAVQVDAQPASVPSSLSRTDPARAMNAAAPNAAGMLQDSQAGTWEIRPTSVDGTVHLRLVEANSSSGTNVPIARLEGLTASQLTGAGGPVQFRVRRDAGTFTFEGVIRNGVGAGTFSFAPDPNFAGELAKRGFARPNAREQYQMARHDIGFAFLDELNRQGYAKPETSELVRAGQHGVDATYLRDMAALGYKLGSLPPLIELRDHGITPDYVRALAELGYKGLSAEEVRRARDHGITPEYVRAMRDAGYGSLPMDALINARDHGISAEYVRDLGTAGHQKVPLEQLIKVRDHGVTPEYVSGMSQLGFALPLDDLVRARDHGITVEFVRQMAALGYTEKSMDALIRVRDHGVIPEYAQELKGLGYTTLSVDDLVTLRDHGLTADRIKAANAKAGTRLPIDLLKSLAAGGMK